MLAGAMVMIPAGAWLLRTIDPTALRWMIAGLAALMLALLASGWRFTGEPKAPITFAVGAVSGLFSGIAQIGGPPVVAYWLGNNTSAANTRANIVVFFAGTGFISLVVYLASGLVTHQTLTWAAITGPAYGLGLFGGTRLFGLASEAAFRRVCFTLIAISVGLSLPLWG
jgi:uncharacterized membrane protein YfcA